MNDIKDKRQRILEASSELFSRTGYFATSMKDVADKAGIAVGTIYLYYNTKEDLLDGIYQYASTTLLDIIRKKLSRISDPVEKLELFINESIHFGLKHPYYFLIVFVDFRRKAIEFPKSIMFKFFHEYLALGGEIMEEGKRQGYLDYPEGSDVIFGITGFWGAYVLREILKPGFGKSSRKKKQEQIYALFEETVLKGLKTKSIQQA